MKLSKYNIDRVWRIQVSHENAPEGELVNFVTKAKYDKLLQHYHRLLRETNKAKRKTENQAG